MCARACSYQHNWFPHVNYKRFHTSVQHFEHLDAHNVCHTHRKINWLKLSFSPFISVWADPLNRNSDTKVKTATLKLDQYPNESTLKIDWLRLSKFENITQFTPDTHSHTLTHLQPLRNRRETQNNFHKANDWFHRIEKKKHSQALIPVMREGKNWFKMFNIVYDRCM